MKSSIDAVEELNNYISKHKCSSYYIEFNNYVDTNAEVILLCENMDKWIIVINSQISLPESEFSTNRYYMIYNEASDTLEIDTGNHILYIMCD